MSDQQPRTVVNVNLSAPVPGVAPVELKSTGIALVFWFFLGGLGGHRFYLERPHAKTMLTLALLGVVLSFVGVGIFLILAVGLWALIDAFSISKWVREHNAGVTTGVATSVLAPEPAESTAPLSTQLLREAKRRGGRITVTQGAMATEKTFEEIEECLQGMVSSGYVDVDNDPGSGVVVYVFGELG